MPRPRSLSNRVRIIGGKWKGRKLAVAGERIRPTPDRARVTLFNWLARDLACARVLDLFAGTGVLGFEALSRGAAHSTFIDRDSHAWQLLAKHRDELGAPATVVCADALHWLRGQPPDALWDVVFLDPPFASKLLEAALPEAAARITANGVLYVEADASFDFETIERLTGLSATRTSRAGAAHYGLLRPVTAAAGT